MKRILIGSLLVLSVVLGAAIWYFRPASQFGAPFNGAPLVTPGAVFAESERYLAADIRVKGRIVRQCPTAGCWFFLDAGPGKQLRIELGHLGLTFPQRIGRIAEVEGRLLKSGQDLEFVGNGVRFE